MADRGERGARLSLAMQATPARHSKMSSRAYGWRAQGEGPLSSERSERCSLETSPALPAVRHQLVSE
jgi:hypothetical protein